MRTLLVALSVTIAKGYGVSEVHQLERSFVTMSAYNGGKGEGYFGETPCKNKATPKLDYARANGGSIGVHGCCLAVF